MLLLLVLLLVLLHFCIKRGIEITVARRKLQHENGEVKNCKNNSNNQQKKENTRKNSLTLKWQHSKSEAIARKVFIHSPLWGLLMFCLEFFLSLLFSFVLHKGIVFKTVVIAVIASCQFCCHLKCVRFLLQRYFVPAAVVPSAHIYLSYKMCRHVFVCLYKGQELVSAPSYLWASALSTMGKLLSWKNAKLNIKLKVTILVKRLKHCSERNVSTYMYVYEWARRQLACIQCTFKWTLLFSGRLSRRSSLKFDLKISYFQLLSVRVFYIHLSKDQRIHIKNTAFAKIANQNICHKITL